jgi:hypothetical protein
MRFVISGLMGAGLCFGGATDTLAQTQVLVPIIIPLQPAPGGQPQPGGTTAPQDTRIIIRQGPGGPSLRDPRAPSQDVRIDIREGTTGRGSLSPVRPPENRTDVRIFVDPLPSSAVKAPIIVVPR